MFGRPAAAYRLGGAAAGHWPDWARPQLAAAVELAAAAPDRISVAALLYRDWFHPVTAAAPLAPGIPLAGLYRAAHAGSGQRVRRGGLSVVARNDVVRPNGWWRTWSDEWTPLPSRPGSVRLFLTPRPDRLAAFVTTVTARLAAERGPWSLACTTNPKRITRIGSAVVDLPDPATLPRDLLTELRPFLLPVTPPLCLPVDAGVGAAEHPHTGMTFGEHRCHIVALGLRHPSATRDPLRKLAAVFRAHGIEPSEPYRTSAGGCAVQA